LIYLLAHVVLYMYICKTQIDVQPLINVQSTNYGRSLNHRYLFLRSMSFFKLSNRRPILKSMSFFKFWNRCSILKSMTVSQFLKLTSNDLTLTLTNKSAIYLRIWNGCSFENTLKSDRDLRYWRQWMPIWGVNADLSPNADLSLSCIIKYFTHTGPCLHM
jgi:hypothetical protein